jgi:hypothetical protein
MVIVEATDEWIVGQNEWINAKTNSAIEMFVSMVGVIDRSKASTDSVVAVVD